MKHTTGLAALAAVVAAAFAIRHIQALQAPAASVPAAQERAALLVTFGQSAKSLERWDGSVEVAGGALAGIEGRHFSAEDAITGANSWKCITRRDEVAPFADVHYTEMRPGSKPEVLFQPVGVYLTIEPSASTRLSFRTAQGNFDFGLDEVSAATKTFLNGRVSVARTAAAELLSSPTYEDDESAIAILPGGAAVAWVAYRQRADRVLMRTRRADGWSIAEEVTPAPRDVFRCALVAAAGDPVAFWSQREDDRWTIWSRRKHTGAWMPPVRISSAGSNSFVRAAAAPNGDIFVAWQSIRAGQSDIYLRAYHGSAWSEEMRLSDSPANDWEPAIAVSADGVAHIAWDTYDRGNYDIAYRSYSGGSLSPSRAVTSSPRFQAHASITVDRQGRPWIAWDESGVNWGKDQGFLIPTPLSVPLHQERAVRVATWNGSGWMEPRAAPSAVFPEEMRQNAEHPQIAFDGSGSLAVSFRHWTRRQRRSIGSPIVWENFVTRFDGERWSAPVPLMRSGGSIEKPAALARDASGALWAAWMTDNRPFNNMVPANADVYCAKLPAATGPAREPALDPLAEPAAEAIPVHINETADVKAIRSYSIAGRYKIYRGDMHRHTDVSQDFKYDGSLLEVYRYARDVAGFDYIAPTDHQAGYDQEFTWWQTQKMVDLFFDPGSFTPLYSYERSVPFPNGHRNVIFAKRGVRTLPVPPEEQAGKTGAKRLFEHLRQNGGISMPHSSATDQGTDWRDNDPQVEPLVEIYQGYRTSYEYEGAPRSATALNPQAQKSGWQPQGFWWNALDKGYKLGVQASSDHWSTHISYACLLAENFTRDGLLDAIRKRHAYAATDNIILDFQARAEGRSYLQGDAFTAAKPPQLVVRAMGTGAIKQVDVIRNRKFVYTARPGAKEAAFEFTDEELPATETYYYVRVLQEDGQLAWSSPVWVKRK